MGPIGIIAGTIFLKDKTILSGGEAKNIDTKYGKAKIFCFPQAVFIPRHGQDPSHHIFPHEINHRANLAALKDLGVREVISINSTGSLKKKLQPGMLVVPDDYILLAEPPSTINGQAMHLTPRLVEEVRQRLILTARKVGVPVADGGTYWQTTGPRLETRAEIRMMANFADIVGMTMASEAVISQELDLRYGALCSIDNFANGLVDHALTMSEIVAHAHENAAIAWRIAELYVDQFFS
jgi:5'-methylthioadenosine phosphorylase